MINFLSFSPFFCLSFLASYCGIPCLSLDLRTTGKKSISYWHIYQLDTHNDIASSQTKTNIYDKTIRCLNS